MPHRTTKLSQHPNNRGSPHTHTDTDTAAGDKRATFITGGAKPHTEPVKEGLELNSNFRKQT